MRCCAVSGWFARGRCVGAAVLTAAALTGPAAWADDRATALSALSDLNHAFWLGTPADGHLQVDLHMPGKEVGAWEQAQAVAAYAGALTYLGDSESGQRIAAEWQWVKHRAATPADLTKCGPGARFNFESDDTGWDIGLYLAAYDIAHDPAALQAAIGSLDCAWTQWWDETFGGGYWYDEHRAHKTMYQAVLNLGNEQVYRITKDHRFLDRAVRGTQWVDQKLRRDDGLYWQWMNKDGNTPVPGIKYVIRPTQSVTMIVGNMTQAMVEMRLAADTDDAGYRTRALDTARGILAHEVDAAGVLINDQDGYVDGWAMVPFAAEVVRQLPADQRAQWQSVLSTSARSILSQDRYDGATFGADWSGPRNQGAWIVSGKAVPWRISVSGGAVDVIVAAAVH